MTDTLTTEAAARRARVADRTIRHWLRAGLVEHRRDPQGRRLVVRASLDAHLAAKGIIPADDPAPPDAPAADPATVPGLPELVAELALLRRENAQLEWRNGHLSALLDEERRKPKLLTAGPPALPEPKPPDPPDPPDDPAPPDGLWARLKARWGWAG